MILPFSVRSVVHGVSLVLVILVLIGPWVGMWQISVFDHFKGNNNACFAGNTIATYGQDNVLYCVNTYFVDSANVSILNTGVVASLYYEPESSFVLNGLKNFSFVGSIYIDDDDEELAWWFNFNPGSYVNMNFSSIETGSELVLQIDDDQVYEIPDGDGGMYSFAPEKIKGGLPSRGYKLSFTTTNDSLPTDQTYGYVSFFYQQTLYSYKNETSALTLPEYANDSCYIGACLWDFSWTEDVCININNFNVRYDDHDYAGICVQIIQNGFYWEWTMFFVVLSVVLIEIIVVVNVCFVCFSRRFQPAQPTTLESMENF